MPMPAPATGVIKKHRVRQAPAGGASPVGGNPAAAPAQARLVQKEDDHAVLEVCCPCGNVIRVECRWEVPVADGQPASPETTDAPQPNKEATQ